MSQPPAARDTPRAIHRTVSPRFAADDRSQRHEPASSRLDHSDGEHLGGGRSGEVYLVETRHGRVARKVFGGDRLARLVQYVILGAPNPYIWNEDAIRCALLRRQILAALVELWFDGRLRVATAYDCAWNEQARAFQLDTQFVPGSEPLLCHPLRCDRRTLHDLSRDVMPRLQERLLEAGLDGLAWQAGKGNPVALNNFLLTHSDGDSTEYCLIDLESGVPALFPLDPRALFRFYIPRAFKFRRPMFDDVDTGRLARYVERNQQPLVDCLGAPRYNRLLQQVDQLAEHQRRWKAQDRVDAAIEYQARQGRLAPRQADFYRRHRMAWRAREGTRALRKLATWTCVRVPQAVARRIAAWDLRALLRESWQMIRSVEHRAAFARRRVRARLDEWRHRRQLSDEHHRLLGDELDSDESTVYMTDFGAHIGLKVAIQLLEITLFTVLFASGVIGGWLLALLIAADGLIYRSSYTLYRSTQAARARKPLPWVALAVGTLPLVGSLAYPAQMIWSAAGRGDRIARFIVYDTITRLGEKLPIWGGRGTLTEHFFNQRAHWLVGRDRTADCETNAVSTRRIQPG